MSQEFSLHPISYFSGNCTNTLPDKSGKFSCHQKYILDINNNVIRRCHNNRGYMGMGPVIGCKTTGFRHDPVVFIFKETYSKPIIIRDNKISNINHHLNLN